MKVKSKSYIGNYIFSVINYSLLTVFCISILYPFWDLIILSFSTPEEAQKLGMHFWNSVWTIAPYKFIFRNDQIIYAYINTIFRTVVGTALVIITSLFGAYSLSKKELPFRNIITTFFVITMFFSGGLIPNFLLIQKLGLMDSILVYILPNVTNVYYLLLARNFLMTLDRALEESAMIDGAGYLTILFRIIVPLTKPVIATIALWVAVFHWNAWFDALLYITDQKKYVLQMVIQQMIRKITLQMQLDMAVFMRESAKQNAQIYTSNVRAAAVIITIGPIILVYPFAQKYFVKGIMIGSLKG